jgi:hypothetical protein
MLSQGGEDNCIQVSRFTRSSSLANVVLIRSFPQEAIHQIEQHVSCIVQNPSYEIPKNVFRLRQAQFKVCAV